MIGLMVPSVSGQVQVTVTPFVDSWKIGEINYLDISVSKIVPNTNFCFEWRFDDGDERTWIVHPNFSENIARVNFINFLDLDSGSWVEKKYGEIDITVIYGTCDGANLGSATTTVNRVNELEPTTEFMMKNYSIEYIDVGTSWSIREPDGEGLLDYSRLGNKYDSWDISPDATFEQHFDGRSSQSSHVVVIYSNERFRSDQISTVLPEWAAESVEPYKDFECFNRGWSSSSYVEYRVTTCVNENFIIEHQAKLNKKFPNLSTSTFVPSVIDKIHSNPINPIIEEKIEASPTYSYEPTHVSNFPDPSKSPQHYLDRYNNEDAYRDWFNSQFPDRTIHEVLGLPEPTTQKIPDWVKNIFTWYSQDQISEDEVLNAIKFLVNQGIIDLDK